MKKFRFYLAEKLILGALRLAPSKTEAKRELEKFYKNYFASRRLSDIDLVEQLHTNIIRLFLTFKWGVSRINKSSHLIIFSKKLLWERVGYNVQINLHYTKKSTLDNYNTTAVVTARHPRSGAINKTYKNLDKKALIKLLKNPL